MAIAPKQFLDNLLRSGLVDAKRIRQLFANPHAAGSLASAEAISEYLIACGELTPWQSRMLLKGVHKGFFVGKHKLLGRIGCGSMSVVYLAQHMTLERLVAIKVLDAKQATRNSGLERFLRESRAAASLDHPNVVRIFDYDRLDSYHYLVLEYVDGPNLQQLVDGIGPLPTLAAVHYLMQAAAGVGAAHHANLVHRDIKPANLLVSSQGVVRVTDLGLARSERPDAHRLTIADGLLGTVDYVSPEQALDSHEVTPATDVYSLGATLNFLITGAPPFPEGTMTTRLLKHQMASPWPLSQWRGDVPSEIDRLFLRMMAKQAADRPTAEEVQFQLAGWLAEQSAVDLLNTGCLRPASLRAAADQAASTLGFPSSGTAGSDNWSSQGRGPTFSQTVRDESQETHSPEMSQTHTSSHEPSSHEPSSHEPSNPGRANREPSGPMPKSPMPSSSEPSFPGPSNLEMPHLEMPHPDVPSSGNTGSAIPGPTKQDPGTEKPEAVGSSSLDLLDPFGQDGQLSQGSRQAAGSSHDGLEKLSVSESMASSE